MSLKEYGFRKDAYYGQTFNEDKNATQQYANQNIKTNTSTSFYDPTKVIKNYKGVNETYAQNNGISAYQKHFVNPLNNRVE
jgi:hypothetical protein